MENGGIMLPVIVRKKIKKRRKVKTMQKVTVVSPDKAPTLHKRSLWRKMMLNWEFYLFVLPLVVYFFVFRYMPMGGIVIAFRDFKINKGIWSGNWVGFKYFQRFFKSYYCDIVIKNTLSITILSMVLSFPIPIILALLLDEVSPALKKTVQTITFAPHFISTVVICGILLVMLSPSSGIFKHIIEALGGERRNFMQEPGAFKWVFILSGIWQEMGWNSIIYVAALSSISADQLEAARIDGASRFQQVLHIKLPALMPTIVTLLILSFGNIMSIGTDKVLLLQNDANMSASEVISTYVYKTGLIQMNYSLSAAIGLFNSVINAVMLIAVNWISKKLGDTSLW